MTQQNTPDSAWTPGGATGLGPMPGTDPQETARIIAGELPELPFLAELPNRGVGADSIGRGVGLLVDLYAEVVPSGWRISRRPTREVSRAKDFHSWDLDAAEEHYAGASALKVQICGPWTMAARTELVNGNRMITDQGAVDDLAVSLAEGLAGQLADLRKRLPDTRLVLQIDEPALRDVWEGNLRTASGFGTVRAVGRHRMEDVLRDFLARVGALPVIASGADARTVPLLRAVGVDGLVVDFSTIGSSTAALDFIGEGLESGLVFLAGTVPVTSPDAGESTDPDDVDDHEPGRGPVRRTTSEWAKPISEPLAKLGLRPEDVRGRLVVTPTGSLAETDDVWARRALTLSRDVSRLLGESG